MQEYLGEIFVQPNEVLLTYYILKSGSQYGILVEESKTAIVDRAAVVGVTNNRAEIEMLARYYLENEVFPCTLMDVVSDYLYDHSFAAV